MFTDIIKLKIKAGNGGKGHTSFRHEKFVINGGPDGGNGGNGGSVIFEGSEGLNNLYRLTSLNLIKAQDGEPGRGANKYGANGKDYILKVPFGVVVKDSNNNYLGEITLEKPSLVVAHGGRGGRGNASFKTNRNQAPDFSEPGKPGEEKDVLLELKLIADIGLLGLPNAGKSTLLSILTNATPKIANYPFTTINPNLGVANIYDNYYTIADIPGVIKGASIGLGLGLKFLRHIERCPVFIHIIDISSKNPYNDYRLIRNELSNYNKDLLDRSELIYLNKLDQLSDNKKLTKIKKDFSKLNFIIGSNFDHDFITKLKDSIYQLIKNAPKISLEANYIEKITKNKELLFTIKKENNIYTVSGDIIYNLFHRVDFNKAEQVLRFSYQLRSLGVEDALIKNGAKDGDTIDIMGYEFIFEI